ncbi:IscS subfamily cysteine desulfurase [Candidatus Curculioniphilus buchneri]|uniref:IscS subfamily cysteine desulfurase n=1 Tax=Candidatus Curculioniphilus buchneri TaxID=690594 RepID=UPI00376ECF6F
MRLPVYLDYSSTTPVDPRVVEKMMQYLTLDGIFGNPSSRFHRYGWQAAESVDIARNHIADLLGVDSLEIIFTSGATESNNLALKGVAHAYCNVGRHIITGLTEHHSVLDTCKCLEKEGFTVTCLTPQSNGIIMPQQLSEAIRNDTVLVSLMHVNNETGVIQDISALGALCRSRGILFHVDASQSVGKLPINLMILPVDLMSFSAHKVYGPKGIGGLFVRLKPREVHIDAQIQGGGHERGMRSGTLPVHQIVGMGEAYRLASQELQTDMLRLRILRNRLLKGFQKIDGMTVNGDLQQSVAILLNVSFSDIDGAQLIMELKNLAVSMGSACAASSFETSHVLRSMGVSDKLARSSIRFSLGRFTTDEEIDYAIMQVQMAILRLRKLKAFSH